MAKAGTLYERKNKKKKRKKVDAQFIAFVGPTTKGTLKVRAVDVTKNERAHLRKRSKASKQALQDQTGKNEREWPTW